MSKHLQQSSSLELAQLTDNKGSPKLKYSGTFNNGKMSKEATKIGQKQNHVKLL